MKFMSNINNSSAESTSLWSLIEIFSLKNYALKFL
jgi:hypothetical protein